MKKQIKKANKEDLKKIAELYKKAFSEAPYNENWNNRTALERINFYYKSKEIFIIKADSKIIGFIISAIEPWYNADRGVITEIVIDKNFRKHGFGEMLIKYVEDSYTKKGVKSIFIEAMDKSLNYFKKFNYIHAWNVIMKNLK